MTDDQWIDGEGIREKLRISGKTQRQLAVALGIDASGVSRLLDGGRKLREDELARIRAFFDSDAAAPAGPPATYRLGPSPGEHRTRRARPGPAPRQRASGDIPVYGPPIGRGDPFFRLQSAPAEYRARPDQLLGVEGAFALFAPVDVLAPRFRSGDTLYVHPTKPPVVGADVFLRMLLPAGEGAVLRYLGGDGVRVRFSAVWSRHPCTAVPRDEVVTIGAKDIAQMGRIVLVAMD